MKKILLLISLLVGINIVFAQNSESDLSTKIKLSEEDIASFKEKSQQKIDEFTNYITIIADKKQSKSKRDIAEKEALKLFYKGAIMETSSIGADGKIKKKQRLMGEYLYRLKTLPYLKVEIKFFDICYVTDFIQAPNGNYYATATIYQEFKGFQGDNVVYKDVTQKEITLIINLIEDEFFNEKRWQLFLGDIKATETRR